jgi:hypothetical protein
VSGAAGDQGGAGVGGDGSDDDTGGLPTEMDDSDLVTQ